MALRCRAGRQPIRRAGIKPVAAARIETAKTAGRIVEQLVAATVPWPYVSPNAVIVDPLVGAHPGAP